MHDLSPTRWAELEKWTPQRIRQQLVGEQPIDALTILDAKNTAATVDLEVGYGVALPLDASISGNSLEHLRSYEDFNLYRAARRGGASVKTAGWSGDLRVAPENFAGRAIYRHLEDPDD
jgi:hypothetical protein